MSISVDVHLLSGKSTSLEVEADASVESLKQRAQSALTTGRGRLLNSSGEVLDGARTLIEAKLKSGDVLTMHVNQVQLIATKHGGRFSAFAWVMDVWSLGSVPTSVCKISCEMCNRSKHLTGHLLQSWVMDLWSPGVELTMVATAVGYRIS